MLKYDTLKNGTSDIGIYGNAPPPRVMRDLVLSFLSISKRDPEKQYFSYININEKCNCLQV